MTQALPAACSHRAPASVTAESWPAARAQLAPPGASAVRLCRYSGLNAHPRLSLVSSRLLAAPNVVGELVNEFDHLAQLPPGAISCPNDDGSQIIALLAYPGGRSVTISVGLTGCEVVTSGSVQRSAGAIGAPPAAAPQLVAQLEHLLQATGARDSDNAAGSAAALTHGHWSVLARSPLGPRFGATVAWDGQELLEIGGTATAAMSDGVLAGGAAYDPSRLTWQPIARDPANLPPANAASVWTGHDLFVFGGPTGSHELAAGCCVAGLYDPATNRWTISAKAPFGGLDQPAAVWTGTTVILAGLTASGAGARLEVAGYDPAGNLWTSLNPPAIAGHEPMAMAIVNTDDGVLLWSLWSRARQTGPGSGEIYSGIDVYRLGSSGTWSDVTGGWPQHETVSNPVFTGKQILLPPGQIWCGACSHPAPLDTNGYLVDPDTLRVTPLPHGPLDDLGPQVIWTGAAELSLNAGGEITGPDENVRPGDIAIWNPATGAWTRGPRAPRQVGDAPAVWSGEQLLVLAENGSLLAYGR